MGDQVFLYLREEKNIAQNLTTTERVMDNLDLMLMLVFFVVISGAFMS
jgi:hypothetical protein